MDPSETQPPLRSGANPDNLDAPRTPPSPHSEVVVERRMDPRLWALLPLFALVFLGGYLLAKKVTPPPAPQTTAPPPVSVSMVPKPPTSPKGKITVTEVPTAPPPSAPAPPPTPAPAVAPTPKAPKKPKVKEEPAVVLPQDANPSDNADAATDSGTPSPDQPAGDNGDGSANGTGAGADNPPAAAPRSPSGVDRDPVQSNNPAQEYPSDSYERGVEGTVRVTFTITPDGRVQDAQISDSSGDNQLDRSAVDYVGRLRFRPALRNGAPASVQATRTVRFSLH